jgi:hypothetical protein
LLPVRLTTHANDRIKEFRQHGVSIEDVVKAARSVPGRIPYSMKFRNFVASSEAVFDLVMLDNLCRRVVVSVIGKSNKKFRPV